MIIWWCELQHHCRPWHLMTYMIFAVIYPDDMIYGPTKTWYYIWCHHHHTNYVYIKYDIIYDIMKYDQWHDILNYITICVISQYLLFELYHNIYCLKIELTNNAAKVFIVWGWYQFKYIMLCEANRLFFSHDTSLWLLKINVNFWWISDDHQI
jgi:hypothetical protein